MDYVAYNTYKNSGSYWLGEIPSHWEVKKLKFVATVQPSNVDKKTVEGEEEVLLCNYTDVYKNEYIDSNLVFMRATATASEIKKFKVDTDDVIVTKDSEDPRDIAVPACASEKVEGLLCGYHLTQIKSLSVYGRYVFRLFQSRGFNAQFIVAANGVTRFGLPQHAISNAFAPVPPPEEQQTIATFLDYKTAKIDALIAKKKALLEKLAEKRTALISHAVTKGLDPKVPMRDSGIDWLGEIPTHWELKKLKYFASNENGIGIQIGPFGGMLKDLTYDDDGEFKVYGQENTLSGDFYKGRRWITKTQFELLSNYQALPGDILFTRKGSIGGCTILPQGIQKGIIDSDTIRLRINSAVMVPLFLLYAFKFSTYFHAQVQRIKRGAILSGLNTATIANLIVIAPPPSEQNEITNFFEQETMVLDLLMKKNESAVVRLQEYRSALITNAVTGKIDVRSFRFPEDHITGEAHA